MPLSCYPLTYKIPDFVVGYTFIHPYFESVNKKQSAKFNPETRESPGQPAPGIHFSRGRPPPTPIPIPRQVPVLVPPRVTGPLSTPSRPLSAPLLTPRAGVSAFPRTPPQEYTSPGPSPETSALPPSRYSFLRSLHQEHLNPGIATLYLVGARDPCIPADPSPGTTGGPGPA